MLLSTWRSASACLVQADAQGNCEKAIVKNCNCEKLFRRYLCHFYLMEIPKSMLSSGMACNYINTPQIRKKMKEKDKRAKEKDNAGFCFS
jgi:hypothetical protein